MVMVVLANFGKFIVAGCNNLRADLYKALKRSKKQKKDIENCDNDENNDEEEIEYSVSFSQIIKAK